MTSDTAGTGASAGAGAEDAGTQQRAERLSERFAKRDALIAVIGLGYVGLPLVELFAGGGFRILGLDIDVRKVDKLNAGQSYIGHISSERIQALNANGTFRASTDYSLLGEADAIVICVPTPLGEYREPDLGPVIQTGKAIAPYLRPGQLVVLESTTYPGTTRDILLPELERFGLVAGKDFFLAYSPEREDPGNPHFSAGNIPKVVGGLDDHSSALAQQMYGAVVPQVVPVKSCEVAEACKILENTYRAVNIALVNELKVLFQAMGINVWEVIEAAKTKPFGFQAFYPGPGLGGHCLSGKETVWVRYQGRVTVISLEALFASMSQRHDPWRLGGAVVLAPEGLETLTLDQHTGSVSWGRVSYFFQRAFRGRLVDVQVTDRQTLRVTDRHPMLVVSEHGDRLEVREAKMLKPGDLLPWLEHAPELHPLATGAWPQDAHAVTIQPSRQVEPVPSDDPFAEVEEEITAAFQTHFEMLIHGLAHQWAQRALCAVVDPVAAGAVQGSEKSQRNRSRSSSSSLSRDRNRAPRGLTPASDTGNGIGQDADRGRMRFTDLHSYSNARPDPERTSQAQALTWPGVRSWRGGFALPLRGVTMQRGEATVYSLEVEGTHTFATTGGIFVHNCIPIDPFYLTWIARKHGQNTRFIELAGEINTAMPMYVVRRVIEALNSHGKPTRGSKILVMGAAYKKDVDDPRESPSFELMELLQHFGAEVSYNDPHIPVIPPLRNYSFQLQSKPLTPENLRAQDCILISTDHSAYDWNAIVPHCRLVVDTRNATKNIPDTYRDRVVMA